MFAEALASLGRRDRIEFEIDDETFESLRSEFSLWRAELDAQTG